MLESPLAFFRGAAALMASDLATTPDTGVRVQACGDCHLMNFAGFAVPGRDVVFDINDFNETLPAPWEWDLKRLTTSAVLAARHARLGRKAGREAAAAAAREYREQVLALAGMRELEIWYDRAGGRDLLPGSGAKAARRWRRRAERRSVQDTQLMDDFPRLETEEGNATRVREHPPQLTRPPGDEALALEAGIRRVLARYRVTLPDEGRALLDRFEFADCVARLPGVGSMGAASSVVLLVAAGDDPLFLQVREARRSVLEGAAGPGVHMHQGQRIVAGERLLQAIPDPFLGWTEDDAGRHLAIRHLGRAAVQPRVEAWEADALVEFAGWCGGVLARAHARSGDPAVLAGYLGQGEPFDRAATAFAEAYADQNDRDYRDFRAAADRGAVQAESSP